MKQQWDSLHFETWDEKKDTVKFWSEVNSTYNAVGTKKYAAISKLALSLLSLPFSNAAVEMFFVNELCKNEAAKQTPCKHHGSYSPNSLWTNSARRTL